MPICSSSDAPSSVRVSFASAVEVTSAPAIAATQNVGDAAELSTSAYTASRSASALMSATSAAATVALVSALRRT